MAAGKRVTVPGHAGLLERRHPDGHLSWECRLDDGRTAEGKQRYRQITLDVTSRAEAIEQWGELRGKKRRGEQPIAKGDLRLNDLADELFARLETKVERGELAERTLATYRFDWERHIKPFFCNTFVGKMTHNDVVALLDDVKAKPGRTGKTLAGFSVNNVLTVMRKLSRYAYEREYMPVNICDRVPQDERPQQQPRMSYVESAKPLRQEELTALLDYMREHEGWYVGATTCLVYTGMRRSEGLGLRWADVDLEGRIIRLREQLLPLAPGEAPRYGKLKETRLGVHKRIYRSIPVLPRLRQELLLQRERELAKGNSPGIGAHVCFSAMEEVGRPIEGATITRAIGRSGKRSGVGPVTPKVLRMTAASIFASARMDRYVASQILGHTPEVYDANYARAYADERERHEVEQLLAAHDFGAEEAV